MKSGVLNEIYATNENEIEMFHHIQINNTIIITILH